MSTGPPSPEEEEASLDPKGVLTPFRDLWVPVEGSLGTYREDLWVLIRRLWILWTWGREF